jgi:hypothetical protein
MPVRAAIAVLWVGAACTANDDVPAPAIASITPGGGRPDTSVVVLGNYFCQQPAPEPGDEFAPLACRAMGTLHFDIETATITGYTDTSITAIVPEAAPGQMRVHLAVGGRSSNGVFFVVE